MRLNVYLTNGNNETTELRAAQYLALYDAIKTQMEQVDPKRSAEKQWSFPQLSMPKPTTQHEKRIMALLLQGEWESLEVLADALANTIKGASSDVAPLTHE